MVASRQVEIPFFRAVGRKRGRGFGALAKVIGRTAISFLRKYIVPAAKLVGSNLLEFAVPGNAEVVSGTKNFNTAAKSVGRQTLRKQLVVVTGKGVRAESFHENLQNKSIVRKKTFLQTFLINHVE